MCSTSRSISSTSTTKGWSRRSTIRLLEDGKEITPVARATPAPGRELSFLEQLIGNLGKFNGSSGGGGGGGGGGTQGPKPNDSGTH